MFKIRVEAFSRTRGQNVYFSKKLLLRSAFGLEGWGGVHPCCCVHSARLMMDRDTARNM